MRALRKGEQCSLTLGVDPSTIYIPERNELVQNFLSTFENVDLQIESAAPSNLFGRLHNGDLDIIIACAPSPEPNVEMLPLYEYDLCLAVPKGTADENASVESILHRQILALPDSFHPSLFEWLRSMLGPSDVRWIECPENSYPAVLKYSVMMGYPRLTPDFSDQILEMRDQMRVRPIKDMNLKIQWSLIRRTGFRSKAADHFWQMASTMAPVSRRVLTH